MKNRAGHILVALCFLFTFSQCNENSEASMAEVEQDLTTITFDKLVVGASINSYSEQGYTIRGDQIRANMCSSTGDMSALPSTYLTRFNLVKDDQAPYKMYSVWVGAINFDVGPAVFTFLGTTASGETICHSFKASGQNCEGKGWEKFDFPANFNNLASVKWNPNSYFITHIVLGPATGGQAPPPPGHNLDLTMTFESLASGTSTTSYTESYMTLSGQNIYQNYCGRERSRAALPSTSNTRFTLHQLQGFSFNLNSLMLGALNNEVGPQSLSFVGNLAGGGTVTHELTTSGQVCDDSGWQKFDFPSTFTNLESVEWDPKITVVTNINMELLDLPCEGCPPFHCPPE